LTFSLIVFDYFGRHDLLLAHVGFSDFTKVLQESEVTFWLAYVELDALSFLDPPGILPLFMGKTLVFLVGMTLVADRQP